MVFTKVLESIKLIDEIYHISMARGIGNSSYDWALLEKVKSRFEQKQKFINKQTKKNRNIITSKEEVKK